MTEDDDERDLQPDVRVGFWRRVAYVLGPVALCALVAGLIYLLTSLRTLNEVLIAGGASLLFMGTTVVFGKAAIGEELFHFSLGTWHLAYIVMFVNAVSTFFYTYNLDLLQKLPKIGPTLRQSRRNAVAMLRRRPWIRRWTVVGVALFVVLPLPGSGALGGALVGRLTGVTKKATFVAVSIAGVIVSSVYALLARELEQALQRLEQFTPIWVRYAVFVLFAIVMIWLMTKLVRFFATHEPAEAGTPTA